MRAALIATLVLAAVSTLSAQAPFPGAVNIDGGWVPCSHPLAIARGLGCVPTPAPVPQPPPGPINVPNPDGFKLGRTYQRTATGAVLTIASLAMVRYGGRHGVDAYVYVSLCRDVAIEDHCYARQGVRLIPAHVNTLGWVDITED